MEGSLESLKADLAAANDAMDRNSEEMKRQIDTAMRKIQNYKEELEAKKSTISAMEKDAAELAQQLVDAQQAKANVSDSGFQDSFLNL